MLVSAYSTESGHGKTTALKVAGAVWGHGKHSLLGLDDTTNSLFARIETLISLPIYWDEIKGSAQHDRFVSTLFKLSRGVGKNRLGSDTKQRSVGDWQTMMVSSSNDTLLDYIARQATSTSAGVMRVLEFPVPKPTRVSTGTDIDRLINRLNENFGHAGEVYAEWLGRNHDKVDNMVKNARKMIEAKVGATEDERLWTSAVATLVVGAQLSNLLGLTKIAVKPMLDFLLNVFQEMRVHVRHVHVDPYANTGLLSVLGRFIEEHTQRHMIVTDNIHIGKGAPAKGSINVLNDVSRLDKIVIHIGKKMGLLRFHQHYFREWANDKGINPSPVLRALEMKFGAKLFMARLGGGTERVAVQAPVVELSLRHTELAKYLED
jgi:hypothetical protein